MFSAKSIKPWVILNLDVISLSVLVTAVYLNLSDILIKHHGLPGFNKILVPLLLVLGVVYQIRREWDSRGLQATIMAAALYYAYQAGSILYANHIEDTMSATSELLKHLLIMIAVTGLILRIEALKYLSWTLLTSGAFIAMLSILAYYSGDINRVFGGLQRWGVDIDSYGNVVSARVGGQIGDPNFYCQVLLMVLPIGLVFAFNESNKIEKLLAGLFSVVIAIAIVCTLSRGGWLMLFAMMLVFLVALINAYGLTSRAARYILLCAIAISVISPFFLSEQIKGRFIGLYQSAESALIEGEVTDGAISGRLDEMRVAIHAFAEHPVLGLGYNNSKSHYQDYARRQGLTARGADRSTHSLYLQVLAEGGIIGSLVFMGIVYLAIRCALMAIQNLCISGNRAAAWYVRGFLFGYLAYLGAGFLLHAGFPRYFWLMTGILISTLNLVPQAVTKKQQAIRETVWREHQV